MTDLQSIIDNSNYLVFFGGAGVSCESGIPDFRSADGLYNQSYDYPPETILSHTFFTKRPEDFYRFYRDKMLYPDKKPNKAHCKLAELEKSGKLKAVITQNIDGFHQAAGSKQVFELHGSVHRNYCVSCGKFHSFDFMYESRGVPRCECGAIVKPDVVLYEEGLSTETVEQSVNHIAKADTLIIAGTSLTVYPAAGFINYFNGKNLVLINRDETPVDHKANLVIRDKVGEVLDKIII